MLGSRHVVRLLAGTLTGRLPNSMVPVGLVLWITGGGGSLAFAGMLAALYGLASGLSQPVKGRLMDRHGQARVSAPAVLLNAGCLASLPLIGAGGRQTVVTAVVGFAGLFTPPLEAGLRALWPTVLPDLGRRRVVQALDTGSQGLLYIVGPLLASWLATAHGPDTALITTAALGLVGAAVVLTSAPSRTWRPPAADGAAGSGRLMSTGLIQLFTALAGTGFAFGAMNVWAAGMAGTHGLAMFSGVLPAAFSTGSLLGSLIYARRARPGTPATQLITTSALFLLGWMPLLTQPDPRTAIVFTAIPGLFFTLIITNGFHTVDVLAPPSRTTEAYAWLILSVGTGQAAGTALAAALATRLYVLAALPAAGAATALTILTLARRNLGTTSPRGRHRRPRQHRKHHVSLPPHERDAYASVVGGPGRQAVRNGSPAGASAAAKEEWLAAARGQEQRAARQGGMVRDVAAGGHPSAGCGAPMAAALPDSAESSGAGRERRIVARRHFGAAAHNAVT
ncbi:MFS transporter [Streptomyces goshikiensis]|uniref:MFS transporter n=1 Tax=Streptomyces goshikiensis TaxID=1942 RepID=UPI0036A6E76D